MCYRKRIEREGPCNNRMDLTAPRGLVLASSAVEPRAHSRTGAAGHAGRSQDDKKPDTPDAGQREQSVLDARVEESAVVATRRCLRHSAQQEGAFPLCPPTDRADNADEDANTINRRRTGPMNEAPANKRMQRTKSAHRPRTAAFAADPQR